MIPLTRKWSSPNRSNSTPATGRFAQSEGNVVVEDVNPLQSENDRHSSSKPSVPDSELSDITEGQLPGCSLDTAHSSLLSTLDSPSNASPQSFHSDGQKATKLWPGGRVGERPPLGDYRNRPVIYPEPRSGSHPHLVAWSFDLDSGAHALAASIRGQAHRDAGRVCDDYSVAVATDVGTMPVALLAVADGVGSAPWSSEGSRFVIGHLTTWFFDWSHDQSLVSETDLLNWLQACTRELDAWMRANSYDSSDCATTIRLAIISNDLAITLHVGDGCTYVLGTDGSARSVTPSSDINLGITDGRTAALPHSFDKPSVTSIHMDDGDILILGTDGAAEILKAANPTFIDSIRSTRDMTVTQFLWELEVAYRSLDDDRSLAVWWHAETRHA